VFKGHDKGRKVREGTSVLDFRSKDLQTCRFGVVHSSPPSGIVSASFCLVGAGRYLPWPRASPSQPTFHFYLACALNSSSPLFDTIPTSTFPVRPRFDLLPPAFPIPWTWICRQAAARRRCNPKRNSYSSQESHRCLRRQVRPPAAPRHRHRLVE
jgi:hypothetical protein